MDLKLIVKTNKIIVFNIIMLKIISFKQLIVLILIKWEFIARILLIFLKIDFFIYLINTLAIILHSNFTILSNIIYIIFLI